MLWPRSARTSARPGSSTAPPRTFGEALAVDPKNIHALIGLQKLHEDQRQWREAYELQTRLSRLRKTDDSLVLGHLQAEMGREAARAANREGAERGLPHRPLPRPPRVPRPPRAWPTSSRKRSPARPPPSSRTRSQAAPERAYLAFDRLARAATRPRASRRASSPSASASSARTRATGARGSTWPATCAPRAGTRRRTACSCAPWRRTPTSCSCTSRCGAPCARSACPTPPRWPTCDTAEGSVFYRDPHICTACRYRADDMLWRCPHCHEWNTFVEERLGPGPAGGR